MCFAITMSTVDISIIITCCANMAIHGCSNSYSLFLCSNYYSFFLCSNSYSFFLCSNYYSFFLCSNSYSFFLCSNYYSFFLCSNSYSFFLCSNSITLSFSAPTITLSFSAPTITLSFSDMLAVISMLWCIRCDYIICVTPSSVTIINLSLSMRRPYFRYSLFHYFILDRSNTIASCVVAIIVQLVPTPILFALFSITT